MANLDLRDLRRAHIKELIDDQFSGSQAEFAIAAKRNPTQVNHWVTGHRNPNGDTCRHIEIAIGLPKDWIDDENHEKQPLLVSERRPDYLIRDNQSQAPPGDWPFSQDIVSRERYEALPVDIRAIVQGAMRKAIEEEEERLTKQDAPYKAASKTRRLV